MRIDEMANGNGGKSKKGLKSGGADLNELAKKLSEKYGFDFNTILELLMKWGPVLVELVLKFFNKTKAKMGATECSLEVKEHIEAIMDKQAAALAETICAHCCLCCDDDEETDE